MVGCFVLSNLIICKEETSRCVNCNPKIWTQIYARSIADLSLDFLKTACKKDSEGGGFERNIMMPNRSVEFDEFSILDEYLSEPEKTLDVSLHEPEITIAQSTYDEVEKYIEVVSERPEEPQKESKEDQPLVLVKPPTLPSIFVRPYKGVDVKERSRVCNTVDTFVLADHDLTNSFVLEVPDELPNLKEDAHAALPKYVDASFVVDISKGEGIM
ncbi:hypothetical protein Sjap_018076 [Stephania japonica]|uniref:Uncharacterized protein n=1 Tax=Stephania japonica TaxID=461633 RepID=A0AAP0I7B0_9MAGN